MILKYVIDSKWASFASMYFTIRFLLPLTESNIHRVRYATVESLREPLDLRTNPEKRQCCRPFQNNWKVFDKVEVDLLRA